jgi:hypothetical protein
VVFLDLVIQDVGVGEIRVQCVNNLLGFVAIEAESLRLFDRIELLANCLLGAHSDSVFGCHPLNYSGYRNTFFDFKNYCLQK